MAFSQTDITGVTASRSGTHLKVAWTSTAAAGTVYQVYLAGALAWFGTSLLAYFPWPVDKLRVDVGTVGATEGAIDFSSSLPTPDPPDHVTLEWVGGTWESATLAGFNVYSSDAPGGAVDYTTVLAFVPATVAGVGLDGFGTGPFGYAPFGYGFNTYSWRSGRLANGVWTFAVVPVDAAGNLGTGSTISKTVAGPPQPPAANSAGVRLTYSYNSGTRVPTLMWLASPG